jgi:hypothetical protein
MLQSVVNRCHVLIETALQQVNTRLLTQVSDAWAYGQPEYFFANLSFLVCLLELLVHVCLFKRIEATLVCHFMPNSQRMPIYLTTSLFGTRMIQFRHSSPLPSGRIHGPSFLLQL